MRGLPRTEFAHRAAAVFARLNQMHPFREGNGRTQREFIRELAIRAGHTLSFDVISRERMIAASIYASGGNLEMMERLFDEISDPSKVEMLRETIDFLSGPHFNSFNWNERYLGVTVAGRKYVGRLVGRQGTQALIVDTEGRLLVAYANDIVKSARAGEGVSFTGS